MPRHPLTTPTTAYRYSRNPRSQLRDAPSTDWSGIKRSWSVSADRPVRGNPPTSNIIMGKFSDLTRDGGARAKKSC
jgi:hypothetical protein